MSYFKFKTKESLNQMDAEDALHEYLEMYQAFLSNMGETLQLCENVYSFAKHGADAITFRHAMLCFKQAQVMLELYAESLDSCRGALGQLADNYKGVLDDVKSFRKQIRRKKLKCMYVIIVSQMKVKVTSLMPRSLGGFLDDISN